MYIEDIIRITNGRFMNLPSENRKINHFKLDSRMIEKDDVFICINSGYLYIDDAISNGCCCVITTCSKYSDSVPIIKVSDMKDTLLKLGSYIRNMYKYVPVVAITGSVGKSTTKELISSILETKYNVLKNDGNKNNYIGVSETIFKLDNTYDICVMELGMNHAHEIDEMSLMIKPNICLITNIGTSHIGNLGSRKNILKAKMEIVEGMNDGYLIVPPDDKYLRNIDYNYLFKCYDIDINNVRIGKQLKFGLRYNNKIYDVRFNVPNKMYINNIILAFKTCTLFDIEETEIIKKINDFKPLDKRMNIIECSNYKVIDDCYNSCYESILGVFDYLKKQDSKKMIILGDILELGIYSKKIHEKINKKLKRISNKEVLLVGNETKYIDGQHFSDNSHLIDYLNNRDLSGFIILIKGSRLMNLEEIRDYLVNVYQNTL